MNRVLSDSGPLLCDLSDHVATITLNRPEKLNAITDEMLSLLDEAIDWIRTDDDVRVVVLTGAGRAFSAGADLSDRSAEGLRDRWDNYDAHSRRQLGLWTADKPVIAAVHGYCLGRACELALWCDIVIASEDAKIGQPEIRHGSVLASIIPFLIGPQQAKLFMLSGDTLTAEQAERIGLVTRCVPEGQALEESLRLAGRLRHIPPQAARGVKRFVNGSIEADLVASQRMGSLLSTVLRAMSPQERGTEDLDRINREQGTRAFLAARDAPFITASPSQQQRRDRPGDTRPR